MKICARHSIFRDYEKEIHKKSNNIHTFSIKVSERIWFSPAYFCRDYSDTHDIIAIPYAATKF